VFKDASPPSLGQRLVPVALPTLDRIGLAAESQICQKLDSKDEVLRKSLGYGGGDCVV